MGIKASNQITLMNIDLAADMPEEFANLEERVTKAETNINQNKEAIELRATKSELNSTNDRVSELAVTAKGVDMTSEDANGKLVSFIGNRNGSGVWESKYTVGGNVVSGLYFDFANSQFVFDGSIVGSSISGGTISGSSISGGEINIGNGTFKVSSSGALSATSATISGSISGSSISGGTISGTTISGGSININNRFKVDSSGNVTLPDNATISWSQVSSKPSNLATTSDIPSDSYITSITQNNVTTTYLNSLGIVAGSVAAENITGTTISGKTISGGTISGGSINIGNGTFTVSSSGALTATSATISGVLKAGKGSSIAGFSVDENSIYSGSWDSDGPDVFMGTGTSGSYTIGGTTAKGWVFGAGGNFGVTVNGGLYCTSGSIAGFTIENNCLKGTASGYSLGLYPGGKTYGSYKYFLVIFQNGGATPVGGLTTSGWKAYS